VIEFFDSIVDGNFQEAEILQFIAINQEKPWCFKLRLLEFFDQKVKLLLEAFTNFLKQSFSFQKKLQLSLKSPSAIFINPFNNPLCSLGSFVYMLFKVFYMNNYPIYIVENEYGKNQKPVSLLEYQYCSFMDHLNPNLQLQYAFNNPIGPKYYKEAIPDLYSPSYKRSFLFQWLLLSWALRKL